MSRSKHADLPLHYGKVPAWLATRMSTLGRAIVEAIIMEYGQKELLQRLSDPLWFQSFGAVLGMDWHSSGITTSVVGALKRAINPISKQLGLYVCGGRGKHSLKTPRELMEVGMKTGLDGAALGQSSRLVAKVDNTALQDGFNIYLHSFIVTKDGEWVVVQQGLNAHNGYARRYHWHSKEFQAYLDDPHSSICGENQGLILNLATAKADPTRKGILQVVNEHPTRIGKEVRKIRMPAHHDVKAKDVDKKRLGAVIASAYDQSLHDFENLLLLKGVGPRTIQSLTLVSEVIYGTPSRFEDPARYSFAHGGKDGNPFPVPTKVYDETIRTLRHAVNRAKIGHSDKQRALKSLHDTAKSIEKDFVPNDNFDKLIEKEWAETHLFGGRSTLDDGDQRTLYEKRRRRPVQQQLKLFNGYNGREG
ncbi:MAG: DUF763 domain-containing protein [Bacteroidota bacterium]